MSERYVPAAGRAWLTPFYDAVTAAAMRQTKWRPLLVERAVGSTAAPRILDLGCGTGAMALEIGRLHPHARLVGIDGDPEMLRRASAKARAAGIALELYEARAEQLPLADRSVDSVVSTLVLHHLSAASKRAALSEVRRVLVPGGSLLVADPGRAQDPVMRMAFLAIQVLDGFSNTRENARGRLPGVIAETGFSAVTVLGRYRTGAGTLELIEARR